MSLGPVMVDLQGTVLLPEEREMLSHPLVGGVILFSRNFESIEQLQGLVQEIHLLRSPRLLVAVDQEGGRVQRFRDGFTRLPAVRRLGEIHQKNPRHACHLAETTGWLMASELLSMGIDISFAPVLDLDYGISTVIGDRAFDRSAETVSDLAHAYMIGMRKAGMAATGKHFPGHGAVHADSHTDLPVDTRPYEDLVNEDLLPFERLVHYDISAIMVAHVVFSQVDNRPASFSPVWIREILRDRLGFEGAVFSDDLSMVAAHGAGCCTERAHEAIQAGCDMVLVCNSPEDRNEVLSELKGAESPVSHLRLIRMHGKFKMNRDELYASKAWLSAVEVVNSYEPSPLLDMDME